MNIKGNKNKITFEFPNEISVPENWFKTLLDISNQARKDQYKWNKSTKKFMPSSINKLIGYTSSVEIILKYNKSK